MHIVPFIISTIISLFSTAVMSYVSLATPIGPWIAPTLVLIILLASKLFFHYSTQTIACIVSAGSIGGILATACAFSFPTLFFLSPDVFQEWMNSPLFFCCVMSSLSLLAGLFGFFIANATEHDFIATQNLSFPIGQLTYKMISSAQANLKKAYELMAGFIITAGFCITQTVLCVIPQTISMGQCTYAGLTLPRITIQLGIMPMICAIGFVTGHVIAIPLALGALSTLFIFNPVHHHFFSALSSTEFTLALCSGVVLFISIMSLIGLPKQLINGITHYTRTIDKHSVQNIPFFLKKNIFFFLLFIIAFTSFFSYFQLPIIAQLYLLVTGTITTYQISAIAGRIGLALLGRFATFVMVPAMLMFNLNYTHLVFIATFIELCGGIATDVLFGRKVAQLANISHVTIQRYQLLGLVISSLAIGIIFWLLINHFGLGSPELCAYRAQSRQLLIQSQSFDYIVLLLGALFGLILKYFNQNPMLVLGGLLMPLDITMGLIVGGLLALYSSNKEDYYPFWSGVFASNSLCMLLKAL